MSLCVPFTNSFMEFYFIMIIVTIIGLLNIGLNMLTSDPFMSCLDFLLGYSTGEFQAVQLIVLLCVFPLFGNQV